MTRSTLRRPSPTRVVGLTSAMLHALRRGSRTGRFPSSHRCVSIRRTGHGRMNVVSLPSLTSPLTKSPSSCSFTKRQIGCRELSTPCVAATRGLRSRSRLTLVPPTNPRTCWRRLSVRGCWKSVSRPAPTPRLVRASTSPLIVFPTTSLTFGSCMTTWRWAGTP